MRRTPIKRTPVRKRSKKRHYVEECDKLVREAVFERDGHRCVRCGTTSGLTPSHVYPKNRYQNMRWLEINILCLCVACHLYWWHLNPVESSEWFRKTFEARFRQLQMLKDTMRKPNPKELLTQLRADPPGVTPPISPDLGQESF
jgi:hypothetical protein